MEEPTLKDFIDELLRHPLDIELFTNGSLNTFANQTNVDVDNRIISYNIFDLGKQLMPIGMLVVLDNTFINVFSHLASS